MFCIEPSFKKYLFEIAAWGYFSETWGNSKKNNNFILVLDIYLEIMIT